MHAIVTSRARPVLPGCPQIRHGIVEYVDRIKAFAEIDRLSLCFVDLDKCEKHVKLIGGSSRREVLPSP